MCRSWQASRTRGCGSGLTRWQGGVAEEEDLPEDDQSLLHQELVPRPQGTLHEPAGAHSSLACLAVVDWQRAISEVNPIGRPDKRLGAKRPFPICYAECVSVPSGRWTVSRLGLTSGRRSGKRQPPFVMLVC
jgi:hypothetical protein